MLSIDTDRLISLTDAAAVLPPRRKGRKPNVATLYRWSSRGCRGVVLETVQVGGTRCTSREALDRFIAAVTRASQGAQGGAPTTASAQHRAAEHDLKQAGW